MDDGSPDLEVAKQFYGEVTARFGNDEVIYFNAKPGIWRLGIPDDDCEAVEVWLRSVLSENKFSGIVLGNEKALFDRSILAPDPL